MLGNPKKYIAASSLEPLLEKAKDIISKIKLDDLENLLTNRIPDQQQDETWYYLKCDNGSSLYVTNNVHEENITVEENKTNEYVSWSYLNLYDKSWNPSTKLYEPIEKLFRDLIQDLKKLPGIKIGGIHFAKPFSSILPHVDYTGDEGSKNVVLVVESGGAIMTVNDQEYKIQQDQIFLFDASTEHSVRNQTDKNFIVVTIRIDSEFLLDDSK